MEIAIFLNFYCSLRRRVYHLGQTEGAMKGGRGTCGKFKVFNLTCHARTMFIDIYGHI